MIQAVARDRATRLGVRLELLTVVWMSAEAALAIGAGIAARSVLLTAFGTDSVIELISGLVLLWRLDVERRAASEERINRVESRAAWISAALLVLLCVYVLSFSAAGLLLHIEPQGSALGLAVSAVALVAMPLLALGKSRANSILKSTALRADIAETTCCAYLAATTLAGVALNTVFGWWWADYAGAIVLLFWLVREAREAIEGAREGRLRCEEAGQQPA
jgi:divalent metal cation (Fe/Co/Zn/Cd) transporter